MKCLLGSAALHGLLAAAFLFGSAFLAPRSRNEVAPTIEFVRVPDKYDKTTDGPSTGGNPNVVPAPAPKPVAPLIPPAPQPPPQAPTPPPKVEKLPEPVKPKEVARPKEPEHKAVGDDPIPAKIKPSTKTTDSTKTTTHINTNLTKRPSVDLAAARAQREAQERADREYADKLRRLQALNGAVGNAVSSLGKGLSGRTASVEAYGPGGGGPVVANWRAAVGDWYTRAWRPPQEADDSTKVEARVTIARDGTVVSGRVTKPSGDLAVDRSVERVLREVRSAPPLPENTTEEQRTVTILFDLVVKRSL